MARGYADNLSKYHEHSTKEERVANARKAQLRSTEAKRERKLLRDYLSALLEAQTETGNSYYDEITLALAKKALGGSEKAYEIIRDTLGQKMPDKVEMTSADININISEDKDGD